MKLFLFLPLLFVSLYAEVDNDFDGVEDSVDRCLDTPFDKLVDRYGCPKGELYLGRLNLEILYTNLLEEQDDSGSFYLDYSYNDFLVALSSAYASDYTHQDSLLFGYRFYGGDDKLFRLYIGIEQNELLLCSSYEYLWKNYVATLSLNYYNQENGYISYMAGFGRGFGDFGVNIYYMSSGSTQHFSDEYRSVEGVVSYDFTKKVYLKSGVNYSIVDKRIYDIYVAIGVSFE